MRHDLFRAVIGQRQDASRRSGIIGARALGHGDQRIGGDVHRHQEIVEAGVDIFAAQFVLVGKADGVDDEIDRVPALPRARRRRHRARPCRTRRIRSGNRCRAARPAGRRASPAPRPGRRRPFRRRVRRSFLAMPQASDLSFARPMIRPRLPCIRSAHASVLLRILSCLGRARRSSAWPRGPALPPAFRPARRSVRRPITIPKPTSQKKKSAIMIPASDAVGEVVGEHAAQQRRQGQVTAIHHTGDQQRARPLGIAALAVGRAGSARRTAGRASRTGRRPGTRRDSASLSQRAGRVAGNRRRSLPAPRRSSPARAANISSSTAAMMMPVENRRYCQKACGRARCRRRGAGCRGSSRSGCPRSTARTAPPTHSSQPLRALDHVARDRADDLGDDRRQGVSTALIEAARSPSLADRRRRWPRR